MKYETDPVDHKLLKQRSELKASCSSLSIYLLVMGLNEFDWSFFLYYHLIRLQYSFDLVASLSTNQLKKKLYLDICLQVKASECVLCHCHFPMEAK